VKITSPANGATVTGAITIDTTIGSNVQWENIYIDGNYLASLAADHVPVEQFECI